MSLWRRFRGLRDDELRQVLGGHQQLHERVFVWTVFALVWLAALTVVEGLHIAGAL